MSESVNYKVSYVVLGRKHPGAVINMRRQPRVGDEVAFDGKVFRVLDVMELMPALGDFGLLHATCQYLREQKG
ncbi:MAG: hypothetical protein KC418_12555 [Anaerolineales bacterium]|nr:hypothetical protein [Anaerolineales bacterium]MCB8951428.1 hypothetical protein [Ardenticatenales bacterium]